MAKINEKDVYLKRAREFEALAETAPESFTRGILLQMAEGYWTLLGDSNSRDANVSAVKKPSEELIENHKTINQGALVQETASLKEMTQRSNTSQPLTAQARGWLSRNLLDYIPIR